MTEYILSGHAGVSKELVVTASDMNKCFSLVNQTVFRERACASERGRGGRENTVWPNSPGFRGHDKVLS